MELYFRGEKMLLTLCSPLQNITLLVEQGWRHILQCIFATKNSHLENVWKCFSHFVDQGSLLIVSSLEIIMHKS